MVQFPSHAPSQPTPSPTASSGSSPSTEQRLPELSAATTRAFPLVSLSNGSSLDQRKLFKSSKKLRAKYHGKVLTALRREIGISQASKLKYHVTVNSSSSQLGSYVLQAALSHHLVLTAIDLLSALQSSQWFDLSPALNVLRRLDTAANSHYAEVVIACGIAIGARRSNHSALIGAGGINCDELDLGRRRETTCTQLALRACDAVHEKAPLVDSPADEADLAVLLRVTLEATMPSHGETPILNAMLHHNLKLVRAIQRSGNPRVTDGSQAIIFDAAAALSLSSAPLCSEADIAGLGWGVLPTVEACLKLDSGDVTSLPREEMETLFVKLGIVGLRAMCDLQQSALLPPGEIQPTFAQMSRLIDLTQSLADAMISYTSRHEQVASSVVRTWLPLELECALFEEAKRQASTRSATVWARAQIRFVNRLRSFSTLIADFALDSVSNHLGATVMALLDSVPDWPEWAIRAALHHHLGEGVLATASFTVVDLAMLHRSFKQASAIFAVLGDRALQLEEGMKRLQRGDTSEPPERMTAVADGMVQAALAELVAA